MKKHIVFKLGDHTQTIICVDTIRSMEFYKIDQKTDKPRCKIVVNDKYFTSVDVKKNDANVIFAELDKLAKAMEQFVFGSTTIEIKKYSRMLVDMYETSESLGPNIATVQIIAEHGDYHPKLDNHDVAFQYSNTTSVFDVKVEYNAGDNDKDIIMAATSLLRTELGVDTLPIDETNIIERDEGATRKSFIRYWFEE